MPSWFAGDVVGNDIRIHYHRTGGDKPAVVITHGTTDHVASWMRAAGALAEDYDVVVYDRRGHGLSEAPGGTTASMARQRIWRAWPPSSVCHASESSGTPVAR